jgi:Ribosome biogenesis protein Nop16
MGRELQKKKKRSSIPKIKMKPKSKRVNPLGNPIIAANWYVPPFPPDHCHLSPPICFLTLL